VLSIQLSLVNVSGLMCPNSQVVPSFYCRLQSSLATETVAFLMDFYWSSRPGYLLCSLFRRVCFISSTV